MAPPQSRTLREKTSRLFQSAAGIQQHIFARNLDVHAEVFVNVQIVDDLVGEVMHIDNHVADAEGA